MEILVTSKEYVEELVTCTAAKRPIILKCTTKGIITCHDWKKCPERKTDPDNCAMRRMVDLMAPEIAKAKGRKQQLHDVSIATLLGLRGRRR